VPLSWNLGTLNSWNPLGHSRPVTGLLYLYHICRSPTLTTAGVTAASSTSYNLNPKRTNLNEDIANVPAAITVWDLQIYKYDTVSTFCNTLYYMDYITSVYSGVRTTSRMKSRLQNLTAGWKVLHMRTAIAVMSRMFPDTEELHLSGLIGTVSQTDMQKMRIIRFFFENRPHWQFC